MRIPYSLRCIAVHITLAAVSVIVTVSAAGANECSVLSNRTASTVVELYTSEGCSSCPPADRWLSGLKSESDVVALAFHVDYWDRLGWKDRFAKSAFATRQAEEQLRIGASFTYTPQVVLNGEDYKQWHRSTALPSGRSATVDIELQRTDTGYAAVVTPRAGAPARLAAYWAVTEHNHATSVHAGENKDAQLTHDFVVREYWTVKQWTATGPMVLRLKAIPMAQAEHPQQLNLVVTESDSGKPVQAVKLSCASNIQS